MNWVPFLCVSAAGVYLFTLGLASIIRPAETQRFLMSFASTARAHFLELFTRLVFGAAFVALAPAMTFPTVWAAFGWVLIATTLLLFVVPWRWHQRFASWSVPLATKRMTLFAIGPVLGGVAILYSLFG